MFNTSKHSSERSTSRRDASQSQRGPSTQRSKSARSASSRNSECKPQWKIPAWVHCEKCYVAYDINPNMCLLSCGHIFCRTCLNLDNALLSHDPIPCVRCKTSETYRPIDGSLDEKLHGMFQQSWTDPVLQLNVRHMQFMMTKTQNYSKFLSKSIKQSASIPPEWEARQNNLKKSMHRVQKLKNMEIDIDKKAELIKSDAVKVYKNAQMLRSVYEREKLEFQRQKQKQQQQQQQAQRRRAQGKCNKDMKLISSGRNEQSNQYIGQIKSSSHRPGNQNQSAPIIPDFSQKVVPPARQNTSLPVHRGDSSRFSSDNGSKRSAMPSATFRPKPGDFNSYIRPFHPQPQRQQQQQQHSNKRLVPSYGYDHYKNPSKRAAHNLAEDLNGSISSVTSSQILDPHKIRNGRLLNGVRIPSAYM